MMAEYLKSRLGLVKFSLLSIVLSLFVCPNETPLEGWIFTIVFLFISFLIFRIFDDAGSVYLDRVAHPERTYLNKENYPKFLVVASVVLALYLAGLGLYFGYGLWSIYVLIVISIFGYLLFGKSRLILPIIPLLKYPILIWSLYHHAFHLPTIFIALSTFFIIAAHDLIENIGKRRRALLWSFLTLAISGILVFQPWSYPFNGLLILPMLIFVLFMWKWKFTPYIPILYYPISYFVLSYLMP